MKDEYRIFDISSFIPHPSSLILYKTGRGDFEALFMK